MKRTLAFALMALAASCLLVGAASVSFAADDMKKMEAGTEQAADKTGEDMEKAGKATEEGAEEAGKAMEKDTMKAYDATKDEGAKAMDKMKK
jgi:uncharacterized protein (DUF2147 family)